MKKIITSIVMFVLAAGYLTAQTVTPTFSYQAVVVDANGDLVVGAPVTVVVNVTDGQVNYTETHTQTTSPNAMINLAIGGGETTSADFGSINWQNATMTMTYTASGVTFGDPVTERVAAVPYALQAPGTPLTVEKVVDYLSNAETTIEDVYAIMDAIVDNPNGLKDDLKDTVVNYIKAHRSIAKQVLLAYMASADANDVQEAYAALQQLDPALKEAAKTVVVNYLKTHKQLLTQILEAYLPQVTAGDVDAAFSALTSDVKTEIQTIMLNYVKAHKTDLLYPIVQYYFRTVTQDEMTMMLTVLENNPNGAFPVLVSKFNQWMDAFFTQNAGGLTQDDVDEIIDEILAGRDYVDQSALANCNVTVDICQMAADVAALADGTYQATPAAECPTLNGTTVSAGNNPATQISILTDISDYDASMIANPAFVVTASNLGNEIQETSVPSVSANGMYATVDLTELFPNVTSFAGWQITVVPQFTCQGSTVTGPSSDPYTVQGE